MYFGVELSSLRTLTICLTPINSFCIRTTKTNQGIIDMNRNGNSANFFSYVCNGKKINELFASTLNGIPASVRYVSSAIIVNCPVSCGACKQKQTVRNEEAQQKVPFFAS